MISKYCIELIRVREHFSIQVETEVQLEEEINQIESKRKEIRVELQMLRVQRYNYRTFLIDLSKKVKEKARAQRKMVEREKKNQVREEAYDDVMEILTHNCIKLIQERSLAINVLRFVVDQLGRIRESRRIVDGFIRESEAEIGEMRHWILKK